MEIFRYLLCLIFSDRSMYMQMKSGSFDGNFSKNSAIVFTRYMILSVARRRNEDDRTICELFFVLMDEMEDISFSISMQIIVDALMEAAMEYFHITESQLEEFTTSFISHLPKCMQEALSRGLAAA